MDMDCGISCQQQDQNATHFQKQASIQHLCNHTCCVCHEFGNVYRCQSSGLLHVCDANCSSRVYRDRYSSICLISRKVHGPLDCQPSGHNIQRKRGNSCSQEGIDAAKRLNAADGAFGGSQGYGVSMEA